MMTPGKGTSLAKYRQLGTLFTHSRYSRPRDGLPPPMTRRIVNACIHCLASSSPTSNGVMWSTWRDSVLVA